MSNLSGQYLGRYHLVEQLGEGGMAIVYRAYDTRLEREVAVKIIRQNAFPLERLAEVLKRFDRKSKALARLSHPNIVKVHDFGEYEEAPFLVLEYLPGGTLKERLGKPIPWPEAVRLLLPVVRGLAYAHEQGILHRDIKPANILITASGEPTLSDFGIAKILEIGQETALTGTGMAIGTPEYMAPEQWQGITSPQSDLYSLGIVLYEMMTGRKPYVADTPAAILLKQFSEPLPRPSGFVPELPEAVEWLLVKSLAKDPADRFENVNALVTALEDLLEIQPQSALPGLTESPPKPEKPVLAQRATPPPPKNPPRPKPKGWRGLWPGLFLVLCLLGMGLLGLLCLLAYGLTPGGETPTPNAAEKTASTPLPSPAATSIGGPQARLYDGYAVGTFANKPDLVVFANAQSFLPSEGVTVRDNCTEMLCWRSSQFLALRGPGTFVEATFTSASEAGVQFWGDTNDGLCRVLMDGQEVWRGDTHGTDVNWPGGAYVKYLSISGLSPGTHTLRVEFVGPGDVTIRYFGFGPVAP